MSFGLDIPGNLLLAGEYAVTESGGLGVALAIQPGVRLAARSAPALRITGRWGLSSVSWSAEGRDRCELFDAVVRSLPPARPLPGLEITVDSRELFDAGGRKRGFGSSAAVAAAVAAALLRGTGAELPRAEDVAALALRAHRAFQGGRGSGYDVTASIRGGSGLFVGGELPSWEPIRLGWLASARLFAGEKPVATAGATERYRRWKSERPAEALAFLSESNTLVRALVAARSREEAGSALASLRDLGVRLGESIGVDASIRPPPELLARDRSGVWKALGAGNELGVFLAARGSGERAPASLRLEPAAAGLSWRS